MRLTVKIAVMWLCIYCCFQPALAQTLRVVDVDPLGDDQPDAGCTLREAINLANAGLGEALGCQAMDQGDGLPITYEIRLPAMRYVLGAGLDDTNLLGDLDIQVGLRMVGQGPESSIIDGQGVDRVLQVLGGRLELENLQVTGGNVSGCGGGILANDLTVRNVWIQANQSFSIQTRGGGGICSEQGQVEILAGSVVAQNSSNERGGGVFIGGNLLVRDSFIESNEGVLGGGVSILGGQLLVQNTTFVSNEAVYGGGIFLNALTEVAIENSSFVTNLAEFGGGIFRFRSENPRVNIANTTFVGNIAQEPGGNGAGGGISGNGMSLTHVTMAGNQADEGGGLYGSFEASDESFRLANSLIAGNTDMAGSPSDCVGSFVSAQYNLIGSNQNCEMSFPAGDQNLMNDQVGTTALLLSPQLGSLPGSVTLLVPEVTSPAVDAVPEVNCVYISAGDNPLFQAGMPVLHDQRGAPRQGACDIGAAENLALFADGFEGQSINVMSI
ncbi:MAG: hypothetical protein AB8B96_14370 [Lysobacterales bacterium]